MKGPTKDYRPFMGCFGGRGYRLSRLTLNTASNLLRRKASIVVLVLSSLFLFINIISLALAPEVPIEADLQDLIGPRLFLEVRPASLRDLHRMVSPGSNITLNYTLTNVGSERGEVLVLAIVPSGFWKVDLIGGDLLEMEPGETKGVAIGVRVPSTWEEFNHIDDGYQIGGGGPGQYQAVRGEQLLQVVASPTEFLDGLAQKVQIPDVPIDSIDFRSIYDPRIGTTASMLVLDTWAHYEFVPDGVIRKNVTMGPPSISLSFGGKDWFGKRIDTGPNRYTNDELTITNSGANESRVRVYFFKCPFQFNEHYIGTWMEKEAVDVPPNDRSRLTIDVETGNYLFNKALSILIIGNDGHGPSNVTLLELNYRYREKGEMEKLGSQYYDMLWGGGIRYERYLWLVLFLAMCGASLISDDIKNNSISLYLSRPLTWAEYSIGKAGGLFIALLPISLFPGILLYITGIVFSKRDLMEVIDTFWLLGAITITYMTTLSLMVSVSILLSSLTKKWIYAGVGIFSVFIFSSIVSTILGAIFDQKWLKLIDVRLLMKYMYRPLFALIYDGGSIGFEWYVTVLILLAIIGACIAGITIRFRNREVAR